MLLRPSSNGKYVVLEQKITHNNEFNVHSLELQTYTGTERIYLDYDAPEIDGDHVWVGTVHSPPIPRPKGFIKITGDKVVIQLTVPRLNKDNTYSFVDYAFNGTYRLERASE
jgi:hypothetical protein